MAPASGTSRPAIDLSKVVLPQPEGPKKERIPLSNSKLTLSRALTSLNALIRPWTFKIAMPKVQPPFLIAARFSQLKLIPERNAPNKPMGKEYATP
jgi:hypothetical protein